jgi:hypothetical protein
VSRTLTLKYKRGAFRGVLSAGKPACASAQPVTVFKKVGALGGSDDRVLGTDATDQGGAYAVSKKKRRGTYYSKVPAKTIATAGNCLAATSPKLKIE